MATRLPLFALSCFLFLAAPAHAETFHVAREAPGASDTNDGLSSMTSAGSAGPWRTLERAAQVAAAGDTVLVHDGDYRDDSTGYGIGVVFIEHSGTAGAPLRFLAAPGARPVLNTLLVHDKQFVEISGFDFSSREFTLPSNWVDMPGVVIDDPSVVIDTSEPWSIREADVRQKYATYMAMRDFFTSVYTNSVDVKNSNNITLRDNDIQLYCFGIQVRDHCTGILIEKNRISYCLDGIFTWQPAPSMSRSIVRRNKIFQCFNNGMQIREDCNRVVIAENDVRFSGTAHISLLSGCRNTLVARNAGMFGGFYTETMQFPGSSAINVHTSRGGIVVDSNLAAYQIDVTEGDGNGFIADLMQTDDGVVYRNNIAYRNMGSGLRTVSSPNCVIVNNTFVENGYGISDPRRGAGLFIANDDDTGHTVLNNVFAGNTVGIKSEGTLDQQAVIDHNLYFTTQGAPLVWDAYPFGVADYFTLPAVQANTPWEAAGQFGNPDFLDALSLDFRLSPWSPAVDHGQFHPFARRDFAGIPRPQGGGFDIGAHESH